jgi:hypothetical protein
VVFVNLEHLNNFLEYVKKIPEHKLISNHNHRTQIIKTRKEIIIEEPYLWSLLDKVLNSEYEYYIKIIKSKNRYIPHKSLI